VKVRVEVAVPLAVGEAAFVGVTVAVVETGGTVGDAVAVNGCVGGGVELGAGGFVAVGTGVSVAGLLDVVEQPNAASPAAIVATVASPSVCRSRIPDRTPGAEGA